VNPQTLDESALLSQVRDGNENAFRVLVERHMRHAYNIAYGFVQDHDDADDIAQEAFVKVHRSIASFRGDSSFATWLHRIVANLSLTRVKQRKKEQSRRADVEEADTMTEPARTSEQNSEHRTHIERALHELPTLQRAVVLLRHFEGLSTAQVSKVLSCSEPAVKTHLFRGLKKMKERLSYLEAELS
jgi:RNA polymerase sigma-70 factor (ECF subfamily)